jgi:hypothetical protein
LSITGVSSPLDYAIFAAPDFDAKLVERILPTQAHFEISIKSSDESRMVVQLLVDVIKNEYLEVREKVPSVLPASCPQRHINYDGSFCLGWLGVMDKKITNQEAASDWWKTLYAYLIRQRRASYIRKWPGDEWAHGHKAAASQCLAEEAAKNLGDDFVNDLKLNKFRVEKIEARKRPSALLKVFRNNDHIYSIWQDFKCLTNSRVPCLCKPAGNSRPKKIKSCGGHKQSLIDLGIHLHLKEVEETKFLKAYCSLKPCCGTLDECPVKILSDSETQTSNGKFNQI